MSSLSERIKKSMEYAGFTLKELSGKIGVTDASLKNYIKNSSNVTVETAKKIAESCNIDFIWLVTGQGTMDKKQTDSEKTTDNGIHKIVEDHMERDRTNIQTPNNRP